MAKILDGIRVLAVSYTHLDVYKREAIARYRGDDIHE